MYQPLWQKIAQADEQVVVSCHANYAATLVQAVRKEKSIANKLRDSIGMPRYGKLLVNKVTSKNKASHVEIEFKLVYNGDKL